MKTTITSLWIFTLFNMIFADILSFMYPGNLAMYLNGHAEGVTLTPEFLLLAALFLEIPMLMILVTQFAPLDFARKSNMMGVAVTCLFVIGGGSITPHYIFFAIVEIFALSAIFIIALNASPTTTATNQKTGA